MLAGSFSRANPSDEKLAVGSFFLSSFFFNLIGAAE
jgi:hypothetical protein